MLVVSCGRLLVFFEPSPFGVQPVFACRLVTVVGKEGITLDVLVLGGLTFFCTVAQIEYTETHGAIPTGVDLLFHGKVLLKDFGYYSSSYIYLSK